MASLCHWLNRSSFSNAWWWPSEPPRMRIESLQRDVRRPDEVDLHAPRPRRRQAERETAEAPRHDVGGVEDRVDGAREDAAQEGRVVDPVHRHEELVERELAAAAHHPREEPLVQEVAELAGPRRVGGGRLPRAPLEEGLPPGAALGDQG